MSPISEYYGSDGGFGKSNFMHLPVAPEHASLASNIATLMVEPAVFSRIALATAVPVMPLPIMIISTWDGRSVSAP